MKNFFDYNKITFWVGIILVIYIFVSLADVGSKNFKLKQKADKLEEEISRLQSEIEDLSYRISYYKTDNFKEKTAREKLNLQQPGEAVIIVPAQKENEKLEAEQPLSKKTKPKTNIEQWLDFLFGS
ncbi:MAG: septum formation initiator family protein [bacterium]|nr:septum formation initiator family protein [bacterium]